MIIRDEIKVYINYMDVRGLGESLEKLGTTKTIKPRDGEGILLSNYSHKKP